MPKQLKERSIHFGSVAHAQPTQVLILSLRPRHVWYWLNQYLYRGIRTLRTSTSPRFRLE